MSYGGGGHQANRGNNNNYPQQQGGYSFPSSSNNDQYNYGMQQQYGGNVGYQEQYYPQENYYEYGREGYDDADYDNLDEIDRAMGHGQSQDYEAEMIREMESMHTPSHSQPPRNSGPYVPQAAMPTHNGKLSSHAHEFWFPEARNCPCCKGFKHGCSCYKNGVDTCKEPTCTSASAPAGDSSTAGQESSAAPAADTSATAGAASPASGLKVHPPAPASSGAPASAGATEFCKYESTPGGCRFGASCRFPHSAPAVASPTGGRGGGGYNAFPPGPPNGTGAKCVYFARGGCQFGEKCRFSHL